MKAYIKLLLSVVIVALMFSCDKAESTDNIARDNNEAAFAAITTTSGFERIDSQTKQGFIMFKELTNGTGKSPMFTDKVKVNFKGWYKIDWSKGDTYTNDKGQIIKNKVIFLNTERPFTGEVQYQLGGLTIDGAITALQYMQTGDKWEVWVPWKLGFGDVDQTSIKVPAYSTTVYEIELVEIL